MGLCDALSNASHTFTNRVAGLWFVYPLSPSPHDMHQLSELALEAILEEWDPQEYNPPHTDITEWIRSIESLCDTYGIPDVQRPQCAAEFIKDELRTELLNVLRDARARFGPVHWDRFKNFMVAFDRERDSIPIDR